MRFDNRDSVVWIGNVCCFEAFREFVPFNDSSKRNLRHFALPGGVRTAVVVGEHEIVREVVHEAAARNEADEQDHADDDGEFLAGQRGFLSEESQQRIADEHEKNNRS